MDLAKSDSVGIVFSLPKDTPPKVYEIIRNSVAADNAAIRPGLYLASINDVPVKPTIDSKELENILAAASTADADSISLDLFDAPRDERDQRDGKLITVSLPLSWAEKKRRSQEAQRLRDERLRESPQEKNIREKNMRDSLESDRQAELARKRRASEQREENGKLYALGQRLQEPPSLMGGKKRTIRKKNRKGTRRTTRSTRATRANQRKNRRMRKNSRKSRNAR
jgi:hypothetical protein